MTCCFIGNRDTEQSVFPQLLFTIEDLICNHNVDTFYMGHNGKFDRMAYNIVKGIKEIEYEHINYNVVLAYIPAPEEKPEYDCTIYPEGLELVPKRFAISQRNKWMIENSDILVCHFSNTFTNSYKFAQYAKKRGKTVIEV